VGGIWGQTRNLGGRTLDLVDLRKRRSDGPSRLGCPDMGTDTQFQTRCPVYRSGTSNVQRSTLNFQMGDRKGSRRAGYGDRHGIWGDRTLGPVDLRKRGSDGPSRLGCPDMGTDTQFQTRCPVYRSGTSNVQRSTLNFQRGDRRGAAWAGYGDRHGIWSARCRWSGQARRLRAPVKVSFGQ